MVNGSPNSVKFVTGISRSVFYFNFDSQSISISSSPTDFNRVTKVHWIHGFLTLLEMAYIKMGQRMVDKSVHGAIWAIHVLVDHPRDEV